MKNKIKLFAVLAAMALVFTAFGCKTDTETEWKDKTYCSAVIFTSQATDDGVRVTMATTTEGAAIYYTTDGTAPTVESTKYSEAVEFKKDATVKAIAIKEGLENSPVSVAMVSIKEKTDKEQTDKEQTEFTVTLDSFDAAKKIPVIKVIREITGLGLGEAKALVEGAPKTVKEGVSKADADEMIAKITEAGGKASKK